jgi:hypothetical protein
MQTALADELRIDYDPETGECLGALIEEARTNLLTYSEDFSSAAWVKVNSNVSADTAVAPDGQTTADKMVEDSSTGTHEVSQSVTLNGDTTYTLSTFAKAGERNILRVAGRLYSSWATFPNAFFDLSAGTVTLINGLNAKIEDVGGGWYRCSVTGVTINGTPSAGPLFATIVSGTYISYTGDGTSGLYIWGAQLEEI